MKLWDKGQEMDDLIHEFTTEKDRKLDMKLASFDVEGSMAHVRMLAETGLITRKVEKDLIIGLTGVLDDINTGSFVIEPGVEDIHSQVELLLTRRLGEAGKKIHLGRSRNDQVLVDLRLYYRHEFGEMKDLLIPLIEMLLEKAEEHADDLMPGYTHMQVAMVSSFGLWFSAYAEALIDDLEYLLVIARCINKNPLGTAAGYGTSLPIDRDLTTDYLKFDDLCINPINAQIGRGKTELWFGNALASIGLTCNKLAMDACLYSSENYAFINLPVAFTTGSSIMPHKKNPDVFELIRAKSNELMSLPGRLSSLINNLPSGYHRDYQVLKEVLFPAIDSCKKIISLLVHCISEIEVVPVDLRDPKYQYLFSVEKVNAYVLDGLSFRDAYQKVAAEIEEGKYIPPSAISHTHVGSIGNLGLEQLNNRLNHLTNGNTD